MANERNLTPFNEMPPERQREIARKGGIASGAARRAKRDAVKQKVIERAAELDVIQELTELFRLLNKGG